MTTAPSRPFGFARSVTFMGSAVLRFAPACSFRSLDGFAESAESNIDTAEGGKGDGDSTQAPDAKGDGPTPSASLASCAAIHDAHPDLPDGTYTIDDAHGMGGSNGDDYDGTNVRCEQVPENFWSPDNGLAERSATVTLRRANANDPAAGLATTANCSPALGAGNTSPTWWAYRDIYVK